MLKAVIRIRSHTHEVKHRRVRRTEATHDVTDEAGDWALNLVRVGGVWRRVFSVSLDRSKGGELVSFNYIKCGLEKKGKKRGRDTLTASMK